MSKRSRSSISRRLIVACGTLGKVWGCWGGKTGGTALRRAPGSTLRADRIAEPDERAGITCYLINGVCHQAANRILLPAGIGSPTPPREAAEDPRRQAYLAQVLRIYGSAEVEGTRFELEGRFSEDRDAVRFARDFDDLTVYFQRAAEGLVESSQYSALFDLEPGEYVTLADPEIMERAYGPGGSTSA